MTGLPEHSGGGLVPFEPHPHASQVLMPSAPLFMGPDPDSQHGLSLTCVLQRPAFVLLPTPSFLCNKEEVQLQMSSCKVIKLTAWGPVLLRAGQQGRVRVHNRSARRDLLVLMSFHPLLR